tara:strand:- start:2914 stop:3615 length:702 start_codon:yes stop_codon:yes gene_type:complete
MLSLILLATGFATSLIEVPKGCLQSKELPCSLKAESPQKLTYQNVKYYLPQDSIIDFRDDGVELLKGDVLVNGSARIDNALASFDCSACVMRLAQEDKSLHVILLEGEMRYRRPHQSNWQEFPKYYKTKLHPLDLSKSKHEDVLEAIRWQDVENATFAFQGLKQKFLANKESYLKLLRDNRFISSEIYRSAVQEKRQAKQEAVNKKQQARKRWQQERESLRKLYYEKHLLITE